MKGYALLSTSTDANITKALRQQMASAFVKHAAQVGFAWQRTPLDVIVCDSLAAVPEGYVPSTIQDQLDDPQALAYHSVDAQGRPYILIGWGIVKANGGQLLTGPDSLSSTIGHEHDEAEIDPYCDDWWDLPDGTGEIPKEVCDSVQGDVYTLDGVAVPNFLWPRYFSAEDGQLDQLGLVTVHGGLRPGGYFSVRTGGPAGTSANRFGAEAHAGGMPLWLRDAKARSGSRGSIRKGLHPAWRRA